MERWRATRTCCGFVQASTNVSISVSAPSRSTKWNEAKLPSSRKRTVLFSFFIFLCWESLTSTGDCSVFSSSLSPKVQCVRARRRQQQIPFSSLLQGKERKRNPRYALFFLWLLLPPRNCRFNARASASASSTTWGTPFDRSQISTTTGR